MSQKDSIAYAVIFKAFKAIFEMMSRIHVVFKCREVKLDLNVSACSEPDLLLNKS